MAQSSCPPGPDALPPAAAHAWAGRWAVVTGGSIRGGLAISQHLHQRGLNVVVHHRGASSAARAQSVVDSLNARRPGSARRWQAALETPGLAFDDPALDVAVVVCNASHLQPSQCGDVERGLADFQMHVSGHAALLASVQPSLQRGGSVVAISDIQTQQPNRNYLWYLVAKAGLETLMRGLAVEWAPHIRCNAVAPGALDWHEGWTDEPRRAAILGSIPLQRVGLFEDLAQAVSWLALDAHYITGQVLRLDGGRSVWLP